MPSKVQLATAIAKAKVKVKRERDRIALEARESLLIERMLERVTIPRGQDGSSGRDGTDAPTMDAILAELIPLIPEPKHTTVVQEVNPTDMEVFIKGLLPEIKTEDRPAVEQITNTIDVSDEKLEGFITKKEFNKALQKIQDAISASQGGGGNLIRDHALANVIEVSGEVTITDSQLLKEKINIILVTEADSVIYLPDSSVSKIVWVQQGYEGSGEFKVCKTT